MKKVKDTARNETTLSERELLAVKILERNRFKDAEGNYPVGHKNGDKLDTAKLAEELGCAVVEISALKGEGIDKLIEAAKAAKQAPALKDSFDKDVEAAIAQIESNGFSYGWSSREASDLAAGTVLRQSLAAFSAEEEHSMIYLTVSTGPEAS